MLRGEDRTVGLYEEVSHVLYNFSSTVDTIIFNRYAKHFSVLISIYTDLFNRIYVTKNLLAECELTKHFIAFFCPVELI